jgi:hypothetical protein
MYKTPKEYFFRLHFPRSRFSRKLEDTLLILANEIVNIGMMDKNQFDRLLDKTIQETATEKLTAKTIHNHRTEMIRLFGLAKYTDGLAIPGTRLSILAQTQDIPRFFKSFCNKFQFPGGFLKPDKVKEMVIAGVKFKPAKYILQLFKVADSKYGSFALNATEATHFIFYDKRITIGQEPPGKPLERIMEARKENIKLDKTGDTIRYARDFLSYMVEANLLTEFRGMYALNKKESSATRSIISNTGFFDGYNKVIQPDGTWDKEEYKKVDIQWMEWFADSADDDKALETPTAALADDSSFPDQWKKIKEMLERKDPAIRGIALKEIGDEGEKIAYEYEKDSVQKTQPNFIHMVKLVSDTIGLGYDLLSVMPEDGRRKKYIEIKTTKKNYESNIIIPFTISINEWSVAKQLGNDYFIYRVIITREKVTIFSIQNPAQQTSDGNLFIEPIGYRVVYSDKSGKVLEM